jgi:2-polyprenyl-6-methoxyphenol hydroxylase-like FAD-dependent oxidoreductase
MSERNAIVIGGGIGGLATAAGLRRTGWRVTVFEQSTRLAEAGAGITLAPNAVRAVDWLGCGAALRERSAPAGVAGLRTASGRWLLRTSVDALTRRQGLPVYALHRGDLHRMLLDAVGEADLRTSHRVTGVTADGENGAAARYITAGGPGVARADLVVAADGVHSIARRALFPNHPGPAYAGYLTWRGVAPADAVPARLHGVTESWGRGQRFGIVPLADGRVYWFATHTAPQGSHMDDNLRGIAARFADWHDPIPALLAATPPDALLRHDILHLATPLPRYVSGNAGLLGDAAHAMTPDLGQGACQALEDAVELTSRLGRATDLRVALADYDRARRGRTQSLVRASARVARLVNTANPVAVRLRDLVASLVPGAAFIRATDEAFGWHGSIDDRRSPCV